MGDHVRHAGRPEWGNGQITAAESVIQDGRACQRVTVRFDRVGLKTLSTAFADLRPAETLVSSEAPTDPLLADGPAVQELLSRVPESATDPFSTPRKRLEATLNLYRFSDRGGSLLDWAAAQTGLKDPLARFSRHELEGLFQKFQFNLDAHLKKLVRDLKKADPATLTALAASASPAAKQALRRADAAR
ncbi:MAG: DUF3553 domain-containing protein [Phycisphaerales bacterium]|nr:DUF3553 domain-containing protein [Phycisphaerales bacterium]